MKSLIAVFGLVLTLCSLPVEATQNPVVAVSRGQIVTNSSIAVASSGTTSGAITTNGLQPVLFIAPAALTSTAMTFTTSATVGGTYVPLYNSSGLVSYTIAQGEATAINSADFAGVLYFKIVLGTSEASARTLTMMLKGQ